MLNLFYFLLISLLASTNIYAYSYPNQAELNALTQEINILQKQYHLLYQHYMQERQNGMSHRRSKQYIKMLNDIREKSILFIQNRNELISHKQKFISQKEQELLALYAVEDTGPDIETILKMSGTLKVDIDLSQQKMRLYKGGKLLYTWQVSTARGGYITPAGRCNPYHTERMHYSKLYDNSPMPYSIFFKHGYAIHGTQYVRSLGSRASHGCVRLRTSNAKKLYDLVKKNGYSNTSIEVKP